MGQFLAFTRTQESSADLAGAKYLSEGRDQRQGQPRVLQEAAEPGISASRSMPRTATTGPTRCPASASRRSRTSTRTIRPGTGRPTRRWRRASSGSRPSCSASSNPSGRRSSNIRRATRASRRIMPALMPITRRLSGQSAVAKPRALLADQPGRSLFPRAQGPDPARIRQAGRGDRAAARGGRARRATSR